MWYISYIIVTANNQNAMIIMIVKLRNISERGRLSPQRLFATGGRLSTNIKNSTKVCVHRKTILHTGWLHNIATFCQTPRWYHILCRYGTRRLGWRLPSGTPIPHLSWHPKMCSAQGQLIPRLVWLHTDGHLEDLNYLAIVLLIIC